MFEDIKPLSSPIDKLLAILSNPVAHMEGNCWVWLMGLWKQNFDIYLAVMKAKHFPTDIPAFMLYRTISLSDTDVFS